VTVTRNRLTNPSTKTRAHPCFIMDNNRQYDVPFALCRFLSLCQKRRVRLSGQIDTLKSFRSRLFQERAYHLSSLTPHHGQLELSVGNNGKVMCRKWWRNPTQQHFVVRRLSTWPNIIKQCAPKPLQSDRREPRQHNLWAVFVVSAEEGPVDREGEEHVVAAALDGSSSCVAGSPVNGTIYDRRSGVY
jgi:hypothetical protein